MDGAAPGTARCHAREQVLVFTDPPGARMPAIYGRKSLRVPTARRLPEAIA